MHAYLNPVAYLQESRSSTSNVILVAEQYSTESMKMQIFKKERIRKTGGYEIRYFTRGTKTCLDLSSQV